VAQLLWIVVIATGAGWAVRRLRDAWADCRSALRASDRRQELTAAYWARVRLEGAGVAGDDLQEAVCRMANVAPEVLAELTEAADRPA
jgi:hypothetical protein